MVKLKSPKVRFSLVLVLLVAGFFTIRSLFDEPRVYPVLNAQELQLETEFSQEKLPFYIEIAREYEAMGIAAAAGDVIPIEAAANVRSSDAASIIKELDLDLQEEVLRWESRGGWAEWEFEVADAGLYELQLEYLPLPGSYSSILLGVQLDGAYPFQEAEEVVLDRYWKDANFPLKRNDLGNEIRSVQTEITGWKTMKAADYEVSSKPLQWHLTEGSHTLRLNADKEPFALGRISFVPAAVKPAYAEYAKADQISEPSAWSTVMEAERYMRKSQTSIQTETISEPHISPDPKSRIVYNVLGGNRWRNAGEWVEWEFEVPSDGSYLIDLKYFQGYKGKSNAYRTIMIDGEVPFEEMYQYTLPDNGGFTNITIGSADGVPYTFHLKEGKHVLRMIADSSPIYPAILALNNTMQEISLFDREIRTVTGNYGHKASLNLDLNRTWDMKKYMPDIESKLGGIIDSLGEISTYIEGLNQNTTDPTTAILIAKKTLEQLLSDVNDIPNNVQEFATIQSNLGVWLTQLSQQPLLLDSLAVRTRNADIPLVAPTDLERIPYAVVNFARTFYLDYNRKTKADDPKTIEVWVQRGRDYVDLLQEMIERDFTPETGIKVKVNLMPNPNVLVLGNAAGEQPDVALGVAMETPVDYAMRDAVADLRQFGNYEEVAQRFSPGALRSYSYNGGAYALPEVQNFNVLFYRTDIAERLGIEPPDTWEDLYNVLPVLQENGMSFYYPPKDYLPFFYQNGAEFYTADGLHTALNTKEALAGFKQWEELFQKHFLPLDIPAFFQHFKLGDIPMGIADFNTYIQLTIAAPEITGNWKIAPIPGTSQPDGTIARWGAQPLSSAIIMNKSHKKEEAWQFLEWWTSNEVQTQYGLDIESFYGPEFRWNTANLEAFQALPWPRADLAVLQEQQRWVKNLPYVPGYYFLGRGLEFAWNKAVLQSIPAKEALENEAEAIEREMLRKQKEIGLPEGVSLNIPPINGPYEGRVK